jgi:hypothetical protein
LTVQLYIYLYQIQIHVNMKARYDYKNLELPFKFVIVVCFCLIYVVPAQAQWAASDHVNPMDHGPFISSTITMDPLSSSGIARDFLVHKGIAVKVGSDSSPATMAFDSDLLRVAGAWNGGALHWYLARDGFQEYPTPDGFMHFQNAQRPGWTTNNFNDPRPYRYGPLPEEWGRYNGLYLNDDKVVFSYTVGDSEILELFGFERIQNRPIFIRTLNLTPTDETLSMQVFQAPVGQSVSLETIMKSDSKGYLKLSVGSESRVVGFKGLPDGAEWDLTFNHLVLKLPAFEESLRFELALGPITYGSETDYMSSYLDQESQVRDLSILIEPGPAKWEILETEAKKASDEYGPFIVDTITVPADNPWNSFIRLAGVDFLSDGRAVVVSMTGDVWLVDGIGETMETLQWKRYATGLNQALGVKVVDDKIYVTGRDQITILHDRNGNDEADFYENFNNEVMAASNYHAFTMNLDTDSKGNFYFAKATPWPPWSNPFGGSGQARINMEVTPHHGRLFKLSPDGKILETIASGLRNPNGMSVGPNDEIIYSDNEGNYIPTSFVQRIRKNQFHGFVPSAHMDRIPTDEDFNKPIVWTPHHIDNSPAQPLFITSESWPEELQGNILLNSYGRAHLALILLEDIDGEWQGTHMVLPLEFRSGLQSAEFHEDGHLYIAGLTSWQSTGEDWGSFHRVRYNAQNSLHLPIEVNTRTGGLELRFSEELDLESATDVSNYNLQQWTYTWNSSYGSREGFYSIDSPGELGSDEVEIVSIHISDDKKSIFLELPGFESGPVDTRIPLLENVPDQIEASLGKIMEINYSLRAADGTELDHQLHKTIHRVPNQSLKAIQ